MFFYFKSPLKLHILYILNILLLLCVNSHNFLGFMRRSFNELLTGAVAKW